MNEEQKVQMVVDRIDQIVESNKKIISLLDNKIDARFLSASNIALLLLKHEIQSGKLFGNKE